LWPTTTWARGQAAAIARAYAAAAPKGGQRVRIGGTSKAVSDKSGSGGKGRGKRTGKTKHVDLRMKKDKRGLKKSVERAGGRKGKKAMRKGGKGK
jgi:hypothetical protein